MTKRGPTIFDKLCPICQEGYHPASDCIYNAGPMPTLHRPVYGDSRKRHTLECIDHEADLCCCQEVYLEASAYYSGLSHYHSTDGLRLRMFRLIAEAYSAMAGKVNHD